MRFFAALFVCLLVPFAVEAKPSRHGVDAFLGDRWLMAQAGTSASDVNRIMRCPAPLDCRTRVKRKKWKKWKPKPRKPEPGYVQPLARPAIPLPRVRPDDAPEPDEEAATVNGLWNRIAVSLNTLEAPRVLRGPPSDEVSAARPLNIFEGLAREVMRALPRGRSLNGVVAPLADKVRQIVNACGSRIGSTIRCTRVAGTRRMSLHCSGKAVDVSGNPSCIYAHLRNWPGGYSTDYSSVRCGGRRCPHVHISYDPQGKREWRARFVHRGGVKRTRYARYQRQRYASAR